MKICISIKFYDTDNQMLNKILNLSLSHFWICLSLHMISWISMSFAHNTFLSNQMNKKLVSQKMNVLIAIKKNIIIRIALQILTVRYNKQWQSMQTKMLSQKKCMLFLWWVWKHQTRKYILHFFMLSFHVSCFQMNQKMSHFKIKSLFKMQEKKTYNMFMLLKH